MLGEGGFARVYKARDIELGRTVALKVIVPRGGEYSDVSSKRFLREGRVIAALQNPHTITLFDFGESREGLLYMAFEYIDGEELKDVIKRSGGLPPVIVAHILIQLLSSLDEAHRHGVLHRDLKPQNVLVFEWGNDPYTVKLLDFGIAKQTENVDQKITRTGALIGTPRYMSPEQVIGDGLTPQSDIFSLGLLAVEMLSGAPAIQGVSVEQLLAKASLGMFEMPQGMAPPGLSRVIEKMCEKEPQRRYPSARAVMNALRGVREEVINWSGDRRPVQPVPGSSQEQHVHTPRSTSTSSSSASQSQSRTIDPDSGPSVVTRAALVGVTALAVVGVGLFAADRLGQDDSPAEPSAARVDALLKTTPPARPSAPQPAPAAPTPVPDAAAVAGDRGANHDAAPQTGRGCGREPPFTGVGRIRTDVGFSRTAYEAYIPGNYDAGVQHPLLVLFHDVQQTGSILKRNQMDQLAEEMGMVVLMPSDPEFAPWWGDDDVARSLDAIDAIQAELCIDPERIFVYGHGAGGRIAERLTCDFAQIAATATMSFRSKPGEAPPCKPKNPRPHLHIATLKNGYVPVEGGKGCGMTLAASLTEYQETLRARWNCRGPKKVWMKHPEGTCWTWDCDALLVSCEVAGGREWPGTAPREWDQMNCDGRPADFPYRATFRKFFESVK